MRRITWALLLVFVFAIPWEYSLVLPAPFGNVARILGLLVLLAAIPAVLQAGRVRTPGPMQWLVLAFYLWLCCTLLWTIDAHLTFATIRGYFEETMIVWLLWEFVESPRDLRALLLAWVAGSWVLALLNLANFASPVAVAITHIRFAAAGQDPNDVARFLDLGLPLAALLFTGETRWLPRLLALGYLPLGLFAVLLTASREGFLAALVAVAGCAILLGRGHAKGLAVAVLAVPPAAAVLWAAIPRGTLARLATIPAELQGGSLNQRLNIWSAGWVAFAKAPILGTGAGSFAEAAHLAPIATAHDTALSIAAGGGLVALFLAVGIVFLAAQSALRARGALRLALATALAVWAVGSLVATVEENRITWLLLGAIALAGRFAAEEPDRLDACFPPQSNLRLTAAAGGLLLLPE
ncbi:MAG: O-antigen ligase family protein [Terracidiphilus sp.]